MSELELVEDPKPAATRPSLLRRLFRAKDIGFYLMIVLAWIGAVYTTYDLDTSRWYWHWLVPGFGAICIFTRWNETGPNAKARVLLVLHEILYWGGVLSLTYLVYALSLPANDWIDLFDVRQVSFLIALILATSTYLAGLNHDWRLCVVAAFILIGGIINVAFSNLAPLLVWVGLGIVVIYFAWAWLYGRWQNRKISLTTEA